MYVYKCIFNCPKNELLIKHKKFIYFINTNTYIQKKLVSPLQAIYLYTCTFEYEMIIFGHYFKIVKENLCAIFVRF
jgi:hypothetical protein